MFDLSNAVKDHFYHPRNVGEIIFDGSTVYAAQVSTPDRSTVMQLHIQFNAKKQVSKAKFKTLGCPSCIAVTSLMTELLLDKNLAQIKNISNQVLIETLALTSDKYYCALLGEDLICDIIQKCLSSGELHD